MQAFATPYPPNAVPLWRAFTSPRPPRLPPPRIQSRLESKRKQLAKAELQAQVKEDLKTVALGTSKINYMDPRITIAWCKRNEVRRRACRRHGGGKRAAEPLAVEPGQQLQRPASNTARKQQVFGVRPKISAIMRCAGAHGEGVQQEPDLQVPLGDGRGLAVQVRKGRVGGHRPAAAAECPYQCRQAPWLVHKLALGRESIGKLQRKLLPSSNRFAGSESPLARGACSSGGVGSGFGARAVRAVHTPKNAPTSGARAYAHSRWRMHSAVDAYHAIHTHLAREL